MTANCNDMSNLTDCGSSMAVMSFASSRRIIQHLRVEPIARTRSWYTGGPVAFLERGCRAWDQILPSTSERVSIPRAIDHRCSTERALSDDGGAIQRYSLRVHRKAGWRGR